MKKTLFYRTFIERRNPIMDALMAFFLSISSWPKLLLETLIRKNFGVRYFSFSGCLAITFFLALYPISKAYGLSRLVGYGYGEEFSMKEFIAHYFTWYAYLVVFLYTAVQRNAEIERVPSVYNLGRYSKSTGAINSAFLDTKIMGKLATLRQVEILLEPGAFFVAGLVLWKIAQPIGILLMVCSIIYSLSYKAAYKQGDDFIWDTNDRFILSKVLVKSFLGNHSLEETQGYQFRGRLPVDAEGRQRFAELVSQEEEIAEAA